MAERVLLVGLGNPGKKYAKNRHNVGFVALDSIAEGAGVTFTKDKRGEWARKEIETRGGEKLELLFYKPLEFMNLSGGGVRDIIKKYPLPPERMVVFHDEIEIAFGEVRWKTGGGHKGHNGLRDIVAKCGTSEFHRVRIGVGRPDHDDVAEHVLSDFTPDEWNAIPASISRAEELLGKWMESI
ncbi:MAG: aminoacyl-tRNA hydrolase [Leptospirales bacterium]|nr:aminoacyl-tRNA hydrolase [Leptospirales bacterium]